MFCGRKDNNDVPSYWGFAMCGLRGTEPETMRMGA